MDGLVGEQFVLFWRFTTSHGLSCTQLASLNWLARFSVAEIWHCPMRVLFGCGERANHLYSDMDWVGI